jgi:prepilin-type N-terminal cleavage/methylation domain-containing protein
MFHLFKLIRLKRRKNKAKRNFTLIELIVVIAIIGTLTAITLPAINTARVKARDVRRVTDINQITKALELVLSFNGSYPNSTGTACLSTCMGASPPSWCLSLLSQMINIPNDPLPNQYCYLYNSDGTNFRAAATIESLANINLAQNDGGLYSDLFETQSTPGQMILGRIKYASAAGGNWSSDSGTWVTSSGGSTVATHPIAGDIVYLDSHSGDVTVDADAATDNIDATGYTHTLTLNAGLIIYGNLKFVPEMTFTPNSQTVTFAATSSGKTITSGGKGFYNVTFNGSGGQWTLQDNFNMGFFTALNFTAGTIMFNGKNFGNGGLGSLTLSSGFTLNIGSGVLDLNGLNTLAIITGTTVTLTTGSISRAYDLTVSGAGVLDCGSGVASAVRSVTISSSNFNAGTGLVRIGGSGNIQFGTLYSTEPLYNLQLIGDYTDVTATLSSNITVQNDVTLSMRSFLQLDTYILTVGGNFTNGGTFAAGTGTVTFNNALKTSTISGNSTFYNLTSSTSDKTIKFAAGSTQAATSLSLTGTASHLINIDTDTGAGTFNLSDTTGTNTLHYTSVTRSAAAGGATWNALVSDGNANGGSNSGWNF